VKLGSFGRKVDRSPCRFFPRLALGVLGESGTNALTGLRDNENSKEVAMENLIAQHIEKTPGVVGGKARIAGHRVRVLDIVAWHEKRGRSPDEIVALFPGITLADVHAALTYYFDHREEIEAEIRAEVELADRLQTRFPSKVRQKLHG
jgi:uncharacterized protein (DUF433 family)